jgi:hypothetical protein
MSPQICDALIGFVAPLLICGAAPGLRDDEVADCDRFGVHGRGQQASEESAINEDARGL